MEPCACVCNRQPCTCAGERERERRTRRRASGGRPRVQQDPPAEGAAPRVCKASCACKDARRCVGTLPARQRNPSPERRCGRARREGGGRALGRAGASQHPVPVPVPAEARQAPWPQRLPPCSGNGAGGRARVPPRPRSRLSSWGTGAAGRHLCCWPSPGGTSPRYRHPCPLGLQRRRDPVTGGSPSGSPRRAAVAGGGSRERRQGRRAADVGRARGWQRGRSQQDVGLGTPGLGTPGLGVA